MELALGTVQFGLVYGVAGAKQLLPDAAIRRILELAFERGMTLLDTAPSYGDIESRLGSLCEDLDFRIVSKIPSLPKGLDDVKAGRWAIGSAQASRQRLGHKLHALLFHRAEDLLDARGEAVWNCITTWARTENILIGASGYDVALIRTLFENDRISIGQLPGNALDQRIGTDLGNVNPKADVHLRSAFLQGLLLLPKDEAAKIVPAANAALQQWHLWLERHGMTPLQGALSIVKSFEHVSTCIVGVDNASQLAELSNVWQEVPAISARELACADPETIDPRLWDS